MRCNLTSLIILAAGLAIPEVASAQTAHWDPPGGTLPVGQVSRLEIIFEDCSPSDAPATPKVDGLTLQYQGQSTNMSLTNGTFTRSVSLAYGALLGTQKSIDIPAFSVATDKGNVTVAAAHFDPSGATVGTSGISLDSVAVSQMAPAKESVWAGEVFNLAYSIEVGASYQPSWGRGEFNWDPSPLVIEDWPQPEPFNANHGGAKTGLSYKTRAIASKAGHFRLNPTSQFVNLSVGVTGFGFFQQRQYQQFSVVDTPVAIEVRPLPPSPQGFSGAVGDFRIASKVVPDHVKAGEPITWTIELSGTGNWPEIPGLPARGVSSDFQVIQPKPKKTQSPGKLFDCSLSEDVVLIAAHAGTYTLDPLDFIYFDPASGSYKTLTAQGATVVVDDAAAPAAPAPGQAGPAPGIPTISLDTKPPEAKAPEAPAPGLGDPIAEAGSAPAPLRLRTVAIACAVPFAVLALFWGILALRRAKAMDPLRGKREARQRLHATLEALKAAPAGERTAHLLAWQGDSAILWDVAHAAPAASTIDDPEWSSLWLEADRCLYGPEGDLPADWPSRATGALSRKTLRSFMPMRLFLPGNLFPFLCLLLVATGTTALANDPQSAYRGGDFAGAGAAWNAQVAADPLDWSARHNLSLALAQQDRWGEAAAHASAAFVQNPSDPAVRRQLAVACDKANFVPEPLEPLVLSGPVESLARLDSPGSWQRIGAESAAVAALSLALLLLGAYRLVGRRWSIPLSLVLFTLSLVVGLASVVAFRAYGIAADGRAVIVWRAGTLRSVPTEADVSQKTTPLPAGSTAIANKAFLGWLRLSFPNGETGWVPRTEVIYIWSPPKD